MNASENETFVTRMSWEDYVAAINAGASPRELLLGDDYETSSHRMAGANSHHSNSDDDRIPAACRLYQTCDEVPSHLFQMVYLRPPISLWDQVRSQENGKNISPCTEKTTDISHKSDECQRCSLYDSELDFDLISMFQPRFVDVPGSLASLACHGTESDMRTIEASGVLNASHVEIVSNGNDDRDGNCEDMKYSAFAEQLLLALQSETGIGASSILQELFSLSTEQWAIVWSELASGAPIAAKECLKLLRAVRTSQLGELILFGVIPNYMNNRSHHQQNYDDIKELVELAAECCVAGGWNSARLQREVEACVFGCCDNAMAVLSLLHACLMFCQ